MKRYSIYEMKKILNDEYDSTVEEFISEFFESCIRQGVYGLSTITSEFIEQQGLMKSEYSAVFNLFKKEQEQYYGYL